MSTERIRGNLSTQSRLSGNLYRSGGGGSTVTIEPVYNTGIKIADYTIDEEPGEIYIPNDETTIETLYERNFNTNNPATIALSESFNNFDVILFYFTKRDDGSYYDYLPIQYFTTDILNDALNGAMQGRTNTLNIFGWQPVNQYVRITVTSETTLNVVRNDNNLLIHKISGIKL